MVKELGSNTRYNNISFIIANFRVFKMTENYHKPCKTYRMARYIGLIANSGNV